MFSAVKNLIVACDNPDLEQVLSLAKQLKGKIAALKLGLEFFTANGAAGVKQVRAIGIEIFLDLKFFDIPNTVAAAVREAVKLEVKFLTIHASGGSNMLKAAASEAGQVDLVAVTILTSHSDADIAEVGFKDSVAATVKDLAALTVKNNIPALVCSAQEVKEIKALHPDLQVITPGIRFAGDAAGDQKRVVTPLTALQNGSDYLVMGRSITSGDIATKIQQFNQEVANV